MLELLGWFFINIYLREEDESRFHCYVVENGSRSQNGGVNSCRYGMGLVVQCVRRPLNLLLKKPLGDASFLVFLSSPLRWRQMRDLSTDCQGPLQGLNLWLQSMGNSTGESPFLEKRHI